MTPEHPVAVALQSFSLRLDSALAGCASRGVHGVFQAADLLLPVSRSKRLVCVCRAAGRLAFPAASLTLSRLRAGLRGSPAVRLTFAPSSMQAPWLSLRVRSLRDLHSPSETLLPRGPIVCPSFPTPKCRSVRSAFGPPLLSFTLITSPPATCVCPLPVDVAAFLRPDGAIRQVMFRPRGFSPPRRLAPLVGTRACCIPMPAMGSAAFPAPATLLPHAGRGQCEVDWGDPGVIPATRFVPFEGFPSPVAASCHRPTRSEDRFVRAPGPLPSCRSPPCVLSPHLPSRVGRSWSHPVPLAGSRFTSAPFDASS